MGEVGEIEVKTSQPKTFNYQGKSYRVECKGPFIEPVEKEKLPTELTRIVSSKPLVFDENGILSPRRPENSNDMVSASYPDEWEKLARMFHANQDFQLITFRTEDVVGPTFIAGSRVLINSEVMVLVPKKAIVKVEKFAWTKAEEDYDYGEGDYQDDYDRDLYVRTVVNRAKGLKPQLVETVKV